VSGDSRQTVGDHLTTPDSTLNRGWRTRFRRSGVPAGTRTRNLLPRRQFDQHRLLNKLTVSQLAELSNLSKSYISQVKHGKCPPSQRLLDAIDNWAGKRNPQRDYLRLFIQSRQAMGVSHRTLGFYTERLTKFTTQVDYLKASRHDTERFQNSVPSKGPPASAHLKSK
jgi:transcriptional regulator with XRE-family HTH domain